MFSWGGNWNWCAAGAALVFRPPQAVFLGIMKEQPTSEELFYLRALMAVLDNLVLLGWLHQDGHLSFRG